MATSQTSHVAPWFSQMALQVRKELHGGGGQTMMEILATIEATRMVQGSWGSLFCAPQSLSSSAGTSIMKK